MSKDFSPTGYDVVREISQGGMAQVYLAWQSSLNRQVALKVMSEDLYESAAFRELFLREARIIARLDHPNIIKIYDVIEEDRHLFISMEYADGGNLKQQIRDGLVADRALEITRDVAAALHFAHQENLIHNDVKPQNILFNQQGRVILADFGIARSFYEKRLFTLSGFSSGTPAYMAPEQFGDGKVDHRADLYALGVVLFEMLSGQQPYKAKSLAELGSKHLSEAIPRLKDSRYQPLVDTMMAKEPDQRPASGKRIVQMIDAMLDGHF